MQFTKPCKIVHCMSTLNVCHSGNKNAIYLHFCCSLYVSIEIFKSTSDRFIIILWNILALRKIFFFFGKLRLASSQFEPISPIVATAFYLKRH